MFTDEYKELLIEFCGNKGIFELIEQCILDDFGKRETFYMNNGKYPEQRDKLMKLKADLIITEQELKGGN